MHIICSKLQIYTLIQWSFVMYSLHSKYFFFQCHFRQSWWISKTAKIKLLALACFSVLFPHSRLVISLPFPYNIPAWLTCWQAQAFLCGGVLMPILADKDFWCYFDLSAVHLYLGQVTETIIFWRSPSYFYSIIGRKYKPCCAYVCLWHCPLSCRKTISLYLVFTHVPDC